MPDATEIEMIFCQATCLPHAVSSDDLHFYYDVCSFHMCFTDTHTYTERSNAEHIMAIDIQAFVLRFVKYLKQTLPPPINSGGQQRLANECRKPLIGV